MPEALPADATLAALPREWPDATLRYQIATAVAASGEAVVVIDDDPTGTQTVHHVAILTTWGVAELTGELRRPAPALYLLSNSRALTEPDAVTLATEIGGNLKAASAATGRRVVVVSRSDSTLRGHYPAETDALAAALGLKPDGVLIAPYFREGGRFTIGDVHYVREGDRLVPAAATESARDHAFGYHESDLRRWVAEKTRGGWRPEQVESLSLELIRGGGPDAVAKVLGSVSGGTPVVVNAAADRDLEVVVRGLLRAEAGGKRFLYRTAASFAKVRAGITDTGLLAPSALVDGAAAGGGLVVVGSYVPRTTRQLRALLDLDGWRPVELDVAAVLGAGGDAYLAAVATRLDAALNAGGNAVLYTCRDLVGGATAGESLAIGKRVSAALVSLVRGLATRPRFIIAKGGITSSDIATAALGVRRALVLGQVAPGVPVWRLGPESRFPGLTYVVFPGNVGADDTLAGIAGALAAAD